MKNLFLVDQVDYFVGICFGCVDYGDDFGMILFEYLQYCGCIDVVDVGVGEYDVDVVIGESCYGFVDVLCMNDVQC